MPNLWELLDDLEAGRHIARPEHAAEGSSYFIDDDDKMLSFRIGALAGDGDDSEGVLFLDDLRASDWHIVTPRKVPWDHD